MDSNYQPFGLFPVCLHCKYEKTPSHISADAHLVSAKLNVQQLQAASVITTPLPSIGNVLHRRPRCPQQGLRDWYKSVVSSMKLRRLSASREFAFPLG